MKRIGFLSFGHWSGGHGSHTRSAADALLQSIDLAVAAEELGADGAYVRVHHFARQLASPFPLLAAMGARTSRIELGTAVIDMRYENPLYLAETAAVADLISGGRLQLGISRGSPETAADGQSAFGTGLGPDENWSDVARQRAVRFRDALAGRPMAHSAAALRAGAPADLPIQPHSPALVARLWWGAGTTRTAPWVGSEGFNLLSSTLLLQDDGRPFHVQQAEQLQVYREHFGAAGHQVGGSTAVTRPVFPVTNDDDRRYFLSQNESADGRGWLDGSSAISGPTIAGAPQDVVRRLAADEAVTVADYVLFTLPNQLGLDYNLHLVENLVEVARQLGWRA